MIKVLLIAIMAALGASSVEPTTVTTSSTDEPTKCVCERDLNHAPVPSTGLGDLGCNGGWMGLQ